MHQTIRYKLFADIFLAADVSKTLILARMTLTADDIVRIDREMFDKRNDFCQKNT